MSKRCKLQRKYYKDFGKYKENEKYTDHYVAWLEDKVEALTIPVVTNWVSVKDELPESGQCVMIYSKDGGVAEGAYLSAKGHFEQWRWNAIQKDVTHWKPFCEPPCL